MTETANRQLPDGSTDYGDGNGDTLMAKYKAEIEALWSFAAVPLENVRGSDTITADCAVPIVLRPTVRST